MTNAAPARVVDSPAEARRLYFAGAHFARGAMAIFRADGRGALESADDDAVKGEPRSFFVVDSFDHLFSLVDEFERWMRAGRLFNVAPGLPDIAEADLRSFLDAAHAM
jgi:hypothetical protein